MKIMHIADLHIGRTIHQHSMLDEQRKVLNQIIERIDAENIDVLIIAGDIYDRSIPSKEAMQVYESFLLTVNIDRKIPVLAVSGNHDGAERLGHAKSYFKQFDYHLSTALEDSFNPVRINDVTFYLVPYIEPAYARYYFSDESITTHNDTYQAIINKICDCLDNDSINILVSHLFVSGGTETASERELVIGNAENVQEGIFEPFDYTLLGHLHTPDAIRSNKLFYSGSIMKYSFSEINQRKGYRIIDLESKTVSFHALKYERELEVGRGTFNEAMDMRLGINPDAYLKLELSEMEAINEPMTKLKQKYPNLLELKPILREVDHQTVSRDVTQLSTMALIETFYHEMTDTHLDNIQKDMINQLLNHGGETSEA
ncbi:exonuclease SbcCD subunit D [Macrococcoides caseolyticum]|uniref:exonuclease SbcCD subunit D n=1 Tax=Macrococcoides caseolyticum TaxID=69966 RepID=UPI001F360AF7|nr:exonuclease SbcCD subunit D [Macrococcus caseolyticus]MCE4957154.1 exonuclease SbcCD subunit D [Macrococcus caseolyticus]